MRLHERLDALRRSPHLLYRLLTEGRYDFCYDQMRISERGMAWRKRANLIMSGLNLLYRRLRPWSMPLHMQFELANYCNLRCPICPAGTRELVRPPQTMDPELFRRVMGEVGPYLLTVSLWGWGESLLNSALHEILCAARRHDTAILLSTNGQYLDRDDIIDALITCPPTHLILAIDGLTDETNSRFRIGARLEPALKGVRRIAEIKKRTDQILPVLHMRFMVMKHNQHELPDTEAFAAAHGFDMLSLRTLVIFDSASAQQAHSRLVPEASDYSAYRYRGDRRIQRSDYVCMQPFWFPSLYADGTLVACEQDVNAQAELGSVLGGVTLTDLWRSRRSLQVRRTVREDPESLSFCRNCPARDRPFTDTSVRALMLNPKIPNPLTIGR